MSLEPGGRPGGEVKFLIGAILTGIGLWLFFDSVRFSSGHGGLISGMMRGGRGGGGGGRGMGETTSMGIILVPLFIGVIALFFDVKKAWAWCVTGFGILVLAVEIVSRLRPIFEVKATHGIMMLVLIAGGLGFMLKGYMDDRRYKENIESIKEQQRQQR
ncbi:MAG: hypothetical protein AAF226_06110, partial [Verrucomicrobiota bacterium]